LRSSSGIDRIVRRQTTACLIAVLLAACATSGEAPVVERSTRPPAREELAAAEYVVQAGDTLYGIAFRHKRDYRQVAAINRLAPPYVLRPGQRLRLDDRAPAQSVPLRESETVAVAPVREEAAVVPLAPEPLPPPRPVATPRPLPAPVATPRPVPTPMPTPPPTPEITRTTTVTTTTTTTPPRGEPVTQVTRTTTQETVPAPVPTPTPTAIAPAPTQRVAGIGWRWPATGRVVRGYDAADPARQGLDIAGTSGQPVLAAADGEVVYSGNGLIGYGELIIIKHDAEFLSAYGYNRKRLVAEGERVRGGQAIAEMGRSPAAVDALHFEIRRGGKPVDPSRYLPRR
jgi:lipoprotein NlpD